MQINRSGTGAHIPGSLPPASYAILRYPHERRRLMITLAALGALLGLVGVISFGAALLLALFVLWSASTLVRVNHRRHVGNALRIGQRQFAHLAKQAAQAAAVLRVPPVQVFIYQDDKIHAYAFGWDEPQAVVLSSELVEAMDEGEFRFVVGHEMGHIALGHTRMSTLVGGMLGAPNVPIISTLLIPVFLWWSRGAEYSADRAGLVACGELDKAISALIKLLVGPRLAQHVNVGEIIAQSRELRQGLDSLAGELSSSHPYLVHRVGELVQFWETLECRQLIASTQVEENAFPPAVQVYTTERG